MDFIKLDGSLLGYVAPGGNLGAWRTRKLLSKSIRMDDERITIGDFCVRAVCCGHTQLKGDGRGGWGIWNPERNTGWKVTKTELLFCEYLIGNGLTTQEAVIAKLTVERENAAIIARQETEAKAAETRRLEAKRQDDSDYYMRINKKIEAYIAAPDNVKELADGVRIFKRICDNGDWNYSVARLAVHCRNIGDPRSCKELCDATHNGNKCTIAVVGMLLGIKMDRTHKGRITQLEMASAAKMKKIVADFSILADRVEKLQWGL